MDRIIKLEFIELNYESRYPKYILYEADNKYYFNYVIKKIDNTEENNIINILKKDYQAIINYLLKYYINEWNVNYESKGYHLIDNSQWSICVCGKEGIIKEITGNNSYPKNYSSFKNYIINKYNTLKIKSSR